MILVDTSVWVDYFNGVESRETDWLDRNLGHRMIGIGDLITVELLQGIRRDRDLVAVWDFLERFPRFELAGMERVLKAAERYRYFRGIGVTIRSTIDSVIAGFCIDEGVSLLYSDRDFDPFVQHFGLRVPEGL